MKILLIKDEAQFVEPFKQSLIAQGYEVDVAIDTATGWEQVKSMPYALVVLDAMLPQPTQVSFCRQVQQHKNGIPVLLLTDHDRATNQLVPANELAPDLDYSLIESVAPQALLTRIQSLLPSEDDVPTDALPVLLRWGSLRLNLSTHTATYSGTALQLASKEFALMELLLRNQQRVFSRSAIFSQLWDDDGLLGEEVVKVTIAGLRQKLKLVEAADLVETVYGMGYRLNRAYLQPQSGRDRPAPLDDNQPQEQVATWQQSRSKVLQRLSILEQALQGLRRDADDRTMAQTALLETHKLVGSLDTFGLSEGLQVARLLEVALQSQHFVAQDLLLQVMTLRQLVESAPVQPEVAVIPAAKTEIPKHQARLLIVDEDRELAKRLVVEAIAWGMQATIAPNPTAARDSIAQLRPDLVVLDLLFANDEDGFTLLFDLANCKPALPVLILTSRGQFIDRVLAARLKAGGFLQKPTTPTQVMETVTQVLEQSKTSEAKILVVDDDPVTLKLLRSLLQPWGLQVTTLQDPLNFWETLETTIPDLLVLDVLMPGINGIELCQTLRNDARWSWLPVLFLTGSSDAVTIHEVFTAGADDYANKPIVAPELITRIFNRLERTRLLRNRSQADILTGLSNRQSATHEIDKLLQLAKRSQQSVCLAVLELDRLHQINQQYGYSLGDKALRQAGQLLRQELRREDVVARWGGAEFLVAMYGMTRSDGVEWLAVILETLRRLEIITPDDRPLQVTFSAGVAQYPADGSVLSDLYQSAQTGFVEARSAGGDRVFPAGRPLTTQAESSTEAIVATDVVMVHPDSNFVQPILQALATRGYSSHWLQTGADAVAAIGGKTPNIRAQVIVLGEHLPELSNVEVLKQITHPTLNQQARIILLSTQPNAAEKAIEFGAFDCLFAPFSTAILMQRIRRALPA